MKTINTKTFTKISQTQPASASGTAAGIAGAFSEMGAGIKGNAAAKIQEYVDRIEKGESYDDIMRGLEKQPDMRAKIDQAFRDRYTDTPDKQKNWAIPINGSNAAPAAPAVPAVPAVPTVPAASAAPAAPAAPAAVPRRKSIPGGAF